jgi:hypothetical protein
VDGDFVSVNTTSATWEIERHIQFGSSHHKPNRVVLRFNTDVSTRLNGRGTFFYTSSLYGHAVQFSFTEISIRKCHASVVFERGLSSKNEQFKDKFTLLI